MKLVAALGAFVTVQVTSTLTVSIGCGVCVETQFSVSGWEEPPEEVEVPTPPHAASPNASANTSNSASAPTRLRGESFIRDTLSSEKKHGEWSAIRTAPDHIGVYSLFAGCYYQGRPTHAKCSLTFEERAMRLSAHLPCGTNPATPHARQVSW